MEKKATLGAHLMAIKWLGNTASHEGTVARDTLLDAFEALEDVLSEILESRSKMIAKLAATLTRQHKPGRKKR